jgi:Spy/CpxP family protein refolding chaperone
MMLSGVDQKLAASGAALSDETYRELLDMMHQEKTNFEFTSDLNDSKNMDMSAQRFSKENLQNHFNDQQRLNAEIKAKAESILTPEQYAAFADSLNTAEQMQKVQLEMAAQMFGGKGQ